VNYCKSYNACKKDRTGGNVVDVDCAGGDVADAGLHRWKHSMALASCDDCTDSGAGNHMDITVQMVVGATLHGWGYTDGSAAWHT
jgi:hypothetical protein